jgi:hypothetical protein
MIKSVTTLAMPSLLGVAVAALPAFAPQVQASETVALLKSDRLPVGPVAGNCSHRIWPDFETSCLRNHETGTKVQEARLVTARR